MLLGCQECLLPGSTAAERFANGRAYGFEGLEVRGVHLRGHLVEYREAAAGSGLPITAVCAGWEGCLLDANPAERQKAVASLVGLLEMAEELGGVPLLGPPLFGPSRLPDLSPWRSVVAVERDLMLAQMHEIDRCTAGLRSRWLLEPLNRYETRFLNRVADARALAHDSGSPRFGFMADLFHMQIEERNPAQTLRDLAPELGYVHLADSNRDLPGHGNTDFAATMAALAAGGYQGTLAIECFWGIQGDAPVDLPLASRLLQSLRCGMRDS